jgi:glutaredoxin-related protein
MIATLVHTYSEQQNARLNISHTAVPGGYTRRKWVMQVTRIPVQPNVMLKISQSNCMKKVAILQSNYIPWKGYFDIIAAVDEFILYDDVQFTKNDWRNRNKIKSPSGVQWLTIPVHHSISDMIKDVTVTQDNWHTKHWKTLQQNYSKSAGYHQSRDFVEQLYRDVNSEYLSEINYHFITSICSYLGIPTTITRSSDYAYQGDKSERVLTLCQAAGANTYLSGASAQDYLNIDLFRKEGIAVEWADYSNYPEYPQLFPPFEHGVSIIDLLFNMGTEAKHYLKHTQK